MRVGWLYLLMIFYSLLIFLEHLIGSGGAYPFSLKNMIMHEANWFVLFRFTGNLKDLAEIFHSLVKIICGSDLIPKIMCEKWRVILCGM